MNRIHVASLVLGCLPLSTPVVAEETPEVQLDPEANELFQPTRPEPSMDGEIVD